MIDEDHPSGCEPILRLSLIRRVRDVFIIFFMLGNGLRRDEIREGSMSLKVISFCHGFFSNVALVAPCTCRRITSLAAY